MNSRPTFGNWQRPRTRGLGRLGTMSTFVLAGAVVVTLLLSAVNLVAALLFALAIAAAYLPLVIQDRWGRSGYERLSDIVRFWAHRNRRGNLYVAGPLSRTPTVECRLPGLAARLEAFDAYDALGRPFVVLHHPRTGHVSTVIECAPPGTALIDDETVDAWVGQWGQWLAELGQEGAVVAAQVVVETRPDPGVELNNAVVRRLHPDGPKFARDTMLDVVAQLPTGAARTRVWVTLTWSRSRLGSRGRRPVDELALEIGQRLPELCNTLGLTGAGTAQPVPEARLAAAVRSAYDPTATAAIEASDEPFEWADAGPVNAQSTTGVYRHDNATSVSWMMGQAPTGAVRSSILEQLLRPSKEVPVKRVTMLYRPYSAARAAQIVDQDVRTSEFQARQRRMIRSRDVLSVRVAQKTAEEEARGAGLLRFAMIVTATTWTDDGRIDRDALARAVNVVEQLGGGARIRFRRAWRTQETAFLAALPLGLVLPAHVSNPSEWRD